jgi:hypothetical protein
MATWVVLAHAAIGGYFTPALLARVTADHHGRNLEYEAAYRPLRTVFIAGDSNV